MNLSFEAFQADRIKENVKCEWDCKQLRCIPDLVCVDCRGCYKEWMVSKEIEELR